MKEFLVTTFVKNEVKLYKVLASNIEEAADIIDDNNLIANFSNKNIYGCGFIVIPYSMTNVLITYTKLLFGSATSKFINNTKNTCFVSNLVQ